MFCEPVFITRGVAYFKRREMVFGYGRSKQPRYDEFHSYLISLQPNRIYAAPLQADLNHSHA